MPFTKEQVKAYLGEEGGKCPCCGSTEIAAIINPDDFEGEYEAIFDNEIKREMVCAACKKSWREYYKLLDIEELDEDGCAISNEEVQAQEQTPEDLKPIVLIDIEGGVIHNVSSTIPAKVLILDYDKNINPLYEDAERALVIDKTPYGLGDWDLTGSQEDQKAIAGVLEVVNLPRCDVCKGPRVNEHLEQFEGYITDEDHHTKRCFLCAAKEDAA